MRQQLNSLINNSFFRNISTLAIGNVVSQVIVVLASFLLARIYSVNDFGLLSLFASLSTVLAILTTGRYEFSVLLPEKDSDAKKIVNLIWLLSALVSFFYLVFVFIIRNFEVGKYDQLVHTNIFFVFPFYTFSIGFFSSLNYWNQRKKDYKKVSKLNVIVAITNTLISLSLGFIGFSNGMIFGLIIANLVAIAYLYSYYKELHSFAKISAIKKMAKKYISFPKYMMLSDLAVTLSQQFVPILFSSLFSTTIVGFYMMANRMLRLPSIVLTSSIADVFRNEAIQRIHDHGNCTSLYFNTLKKLLLIAIPGFVIVYFISPFCFSLVLGEKWAMSGEFAQILCIVVFFEFITLPMNSLFYIFEKQKIYMLIQVLNFICGLCAILITFRFSKNVMYCILIYSLISAIFSVISLTYTYKLSKRFINISNN